MILTFRILTLIIAFVSFIFVFGSGIEKDTKMNATALCIVSMASFIISTMWL